MGMKRVSERGPRRKAKLREAKRLAEDAEWSAHEQQQQQQKRRRDRPSPDRPAAPSAATGELGSAEGWLQLVKKAPKSSAANASDSASIVRARSKLQPKPQSSQHPSPSGAAVAAALTQTFDQRPRKRPSAVQSDSHTESPEARGSPEPERVESPPKRRKASRRGKGGRGKAGEKQQDSDAAAVSIAEHVSGPASTTVAELVAASVPVDINEEKVAGTAFMRKVPTDATVDEITAVLSRYGKVTSVRLVRGADRAPNGNVFADFEYNKAVHRAATAAKAGKIVIRGAKVMLTPALTKKGLHAIATGNTTRTDKKGRKQNKPQPSAETGRRRESGQIHRGKGDRSERKGDVKGRQSNSRSGKSFAGGRGGSRGRGKSREQKGRGGGSGRGSSGSGRTGGRGEGRSKSRPPDKE